MAWTTPKTWLAGAPLLAADLNTHVRDNLAALKAPPTDTHDANEASDWSTTSTTFTAIDNVDLSLSLTTTGGDILVAFCGNFIASAANSVYLQVVLDGVGKQGDDGYISEYLDRSAAPGRSVSFSYLIEGVAAGTHTIVINWKTSGGTVTMFGGAGTANGDLHPQFMAREV